jgi:hypothetical protein
MLCPSDAAGSDREDVRTLFLPLETILDMRSAQRSHWFLKPATLSLKCLSSRFSLNSATGFDKFKMALLKYTRIVNRNGIDPVRAKADDGRN